ncbi:MAG: hypothetical protein R6W31_20505 [Bacteroidales bacterium]
MFQLNEEQINSNDKIVVLAAECWNGALDAGRFVAKLLFDSRTRIILLNTYQHPFASVSMLRKIDELLKHTAEEDLLRIKTSLVKEYGIPPDRIHNLAINGDLKTVIRREFDHLQNISIVLGHDINNPFRKGSCRKVINALLKSSTRPIFHISGFVTVVEQSRVVIIADKEEVVSPLYLRYLVDQSGQDENHLEIVTTDNGNRIEMNKDTAAHFSNMLNGSDFSINTLEHTFYDLAIKAFSA